MASNAPLLLRLVASSVSIANHAGKIIRDVMSHGELGIIDKGGNDPQTEADRRAQQCIVGNLARKFPSLQIIGEEDIPQGKDIPDVSEVAKDILELTCPKELAELREDELVIWVDPLDGTSEYTQGMLDHVTVLIGVAHRERPIAGVIHQPYYNYQTGQKQLGRTLWGIPGIGSGGFQPQHPPQNKKVIATTRSHQSDLVIQSIEALKPDEVLKVGGAGYKILLLMDGQANAYVYASSGCNKWDTCAPEAVLMSVGGYLTDIYGQPYCYGAQAEKVNKRGVLATALVKDHQWFIDNIPDNVKEALA